MTRARPAAGCRDLAFQAGYAVGDEGEVALEDYARSLTRAGAVEAVRAGGDASVVTGLHLCEADAPPSPAAAVDIEDFARELAVGTRTGGLGWS